MLEVSVSLSQLRRNVCALRERTAAKLCAVVKADMYGLGLSALSALDEADEFAVANLTEAADLRLRTDKPIHILSLPDLRDTREYPSGVYPAVADADTIRHARKHGADGIDIKVDTGMHRFGMPPDALGEALKEAKAAGIAVRSVFSHLYDLSAAPMQFGRFLKATQPFLDEIPERHLASSLFVSLPPVMHLDMVRAGIVLYGYGHPCVRPAVRAVCPVLQVRTVPAGENVGYGICPCDHTRKIAVLGAGYADGIRRIQAGEPRYVEIGNHLCPVVGQICMDAMMADVGGIDVAAGDMATVYGDRYGIGSAATACGTVPYEILTGLGGRAVRTYVRE